MRNHNRVARLEQAAFPKSGIRVISYDGNTPETRGPTIQWRDGVRVIVVSAMDERI